MAELTVTKRDNSRHELHLSFLSLSNAYVIEDDLG